MNDSSKDLDAFSDLDVGGLDKYEKRNTDALMAERARSLDERIKAFLTLKRNVEWAKDAPAFCDSVEPECRELAGISAMAGELDSIREEARLLLARYEREKAEEEARAARRAEEEAERAARLAEQEAARQKEAIRSKAREMSELISALEAAKPSGIWCENLEVAINEIRTLPREITLLITNLDALDLLDEKRNTFLQATEADKRLRQLRDTAHSEKWAKEVKKYCASVSERLHPYMNEKGLLTALADEAEEYLSHLTELRKEEEMRPIKEAAAEVMRQLEALEAGETEDVYGLTYYGKNYEQQLFTSKVRDYLYENTDFEERYQKAQEKLIAKGKAAKAAEAAAKAKRVLIRNAINTAAVLAVSAVLLILGLLVDEVFIGAAVAFSLILIPYYLLPLWLGKYNNDIAFFVGDIILKVALLVLVFMTETVIDGEITLWLAVTLAASALDILLAHIVKKINEHEFRPTHTVAYGTRFGTRYADEVWPAYYWIKIGFSVIGAIAFLIIII